MRLFPWVGAGIVLAIVPVAGSAQEYFPTPTLGVRGGYAFNQQSPIVGFASSVPLDGRLEVMLGGDLVLRDRDERWRIGADLLLRMGGAGEYYAGAGVALFDFRRPELANRSEFGYSIAAGREFRRADAAVLRPFIEPRLSVVAGRSSFQLAAGLNYALELPF